MKNTFSKIFVFLILTSFLVSCGSKQSSATLKISSSFMLSNASFPGGLIIRGKSAGKDFSFAIPSGSGATNEAQIELPQGSWEFWASAWSGPVSFGGNVFCGKAIANLTSDQATVQINVNQISCDDASFRTATEMLTNAQSTSESGNYIRKFSLSSCGSFYDSGNAVVVNGGPANFCDLGVPLDMRSKVKSFKIKAPRKSLAGTISTGFESNCYESSGNSVIRPVDTLRLPSVNIPYIVEIYKDNNCGELIASHSLHEGLSSSYPGSDKLLLSDSDTPNARSNLSLPSNELKKGYTPFYHILPSFDCGGIPCLVSATSFQYYGVANSTVSVRIDENPNASCTDYDAVPPASATLATDGITTITCSDTGDGVDMNISLVGSAYSNGTYDFRFNYQKDGYSPQLIEMYIFPTQDKLNAFKFTWEQLGRDPSGARIAQNGGGHDDHDVFGALSTVRDMLGPDGAGGLFGEPVTASPATCINTIGTKEITLFEEEDQQYKTYRAEIVAPNFFQPVNVNSFCHLSAYSGVCVGGTDPTYDKKMKISRLIGPGNYELIMSINFNCTEKIGSLMEINDEVRNDGRREVHKNLVFWNTPTTTPKFQRFERYSSNHEFANGTDPERINTSIVRVMKDDADAGGNTYQIDGTEYGREYTSNTVYNEHAARYFIRGNRLGGEIAAKVMGLDKTGATATLNMFNEVNEPYLTDRGVTTYPGSFTFQLVPATLAGTTGITWNGSIPMALIADPTNMFNKIIHADPDHMDLYIFADGIYMPSIFN